MAFSLPDYLVTDDLTILLGLIAATFFLLTNLYKPQPIVHPILLGRQSDVARVRNPGESAVYRNYGTGLMGRFPVRPSKEVHILADLVKQDSEASRTLWSTKITNLHLQDRVAAFGTGLLRLAGLQPQKSQVLLLLNDSFEFIISDLALASHSITSLTVSSSTLLSPILDLHSPSAIITHADLLSQILEFIYDSGHRHDSYTIIVVGEPSAQVMASVSSKVQVLLFSEIEREGVRVEKIISPPPKPSDVFTVSFYTTGSGHIQGAQLTHENMTAGVAAIRALLPLSHAITPLDTIVSAHSLSTAYGRAITYTALFEGTSFATVESSKIYHAENKPADVADVLSSKNYPIPCPTILFIKPGHLTAMVSEITKQASKSFLLYSFAWRHKLAGVAEGHLSKESLWDRLIFDSARAKVISGGAGTLRAVIVSGGPIDANSLTPARVALSVPLVNAYTHPLVPGPVLASHPLDLQDFPATTGGVPAHVGPPSVNIEVKLGGVDDELLEAGANPVGTLFLHGPPVGKALAVEDYVSIPTEDDKEGWVQTEDRVRVQTNGSFQILPK